MRIYKIFTKKLITLLSNDNSLSFNRATLLRSARKFNSSVPLMIRVEWILNWRKYLSTSTATRVYVQTTCIRKNANRAGTFRLITRLRVKFEWLKRARRLLPVEQWFSIKPCVSDTSRMVISETPLKGSIFRRVYSRVNFPVSTRDSPISVA